MVTKQKEVKHWYVFCDCCERDGETPVVSAEKPKKCPGCQAENIDVHEQYTLF